MKVLTTGLPGVASVTSRAKVRAKNIYFGS